MASALITVDEAKPLLLILDDDGGHVDEWLESHPPSRLGAPAALDNGTNPSPIWVLKVPSLDQLAELAPTQDPVFTKADELVRNATAQVAEIQNNNNIPVHAGKVKSKKQCRTEAQDAFHDEIMLMTADHPLWGQGKWTMLIRPSEFDRVFAQLAKSLASGDLKHSSIIAIRARVLPSDEGATDSNKRPKTSLGRRSSNRSPTSSKQPPVLLGIDIFFRPVWDSNAAREVLRVVAGACGRMASLCKSSLYSRLGIKKEHQLGGHASLYNSKTLVSPADAKLWVAAYSADGNAASNRSHLVDESPFRDASSAAAPAKEAESFIDGEGVPFCAIKRPLEDASVLHAGFRADKKARSSGNEDDTKQQLVSAPVKAASLPGEEAQSKAKEEEAVEPESQDEPMLPVRATSKPSTDGAPKSLSTVSEEIPDQISATAPDTSIAYERQEKLARPVVDASQGKVVPCMDEETQTQEEPPGADRRGVIIKEPNESKSDGNKENEPRKYEVVTCQEDADAEGESIEEEHGSQETPQHTDGEQQAAVKAQEVLAAEKRICSQEQTQEASDVNRGPEQAAMSTGPSEEGEQNQPTVTAAVATEAAWQTGNNVAMVSDATLNLDGKASASTEIDKGGCSSCNQPSIAVGTTEETDTAGKSHEETLCGIQNDAQSSKATPHDSVAEDTAVVQDTFDAQARRAEALVALMLPEVNREDTLAEPKSVVESSIGAPAQAAANCADHVQQAVDNDPPVSVRIDVSELKPAETATSEPTSEAKPDGSKTLAADHNGIKEDKADGHTISARADGVEMSMDELIVEGATAEPSVPGQGGLEAGAK
ncbi:hypothetical protein PHBOTO_006140 [Pseudozyma hubeiensis]|nr:hypothetical protein PHBOTO_006140 [Pseudozyma hubeiensis]